MRAVLILVALVASGQLVAKTAPCATEAVKYCNFVKRADQKKCLKRHGRVLSSACKANLKGGKP